MGAIDYVSRGEFEEWAKRVRDLETQSPIESTSVSNGRLRFIGGLLRVDAGGRVEIVGTLAVDGATTVTGTFTLTGPLVVDGAWDLNGAGTIAGDVDVSGALTATGKLTQNGIWELNGVGDINGDVDVTGDVNLTGELTVAGTNQIKLHNDGGAATITAGGGRLRGSVDGINVQAVGGGSLFAASGGAAGAGCTYGTYQIAATPTGIQMLGLSSSVPAGAKLLYLDPSTNRVFRQA